GLTLVPSQGCPPSRLVNVNCGQHKGGWTAMHDPTQQPERVTLGVDTHAEQHVAAALDERGRLLGTCTFPTTLSGFAELVRWASQYGELGLVGIEGTGSYGAGLARWLHSRSVTVIEVDRPDRRTRRRRGK